jgi:glycosyltransferase involved in cell wall biosynthesis
MDFYRLIKKHGFVGCARKALGIIRHRAYYQMFIQLWDRPYWRDLPKIYRCIHHLSYRPQISVVMPVYRIDVRYLKRAVESVRQQIYPHWQLCIADDASGDMRISRYLNAIAADEPRISVVFRESNGHICAASNSAIALATGEYIALLDHDDVLHPLALFHVAKTLAARPDAEVLYSDEDRITAYGWRYGPHHKPAFLSEHWLDLCNMVSHLGVYRRKSVVALGGFRQGYEGSQDYDLALRFFARFGPSRFVHIPHVLYHWGVVEGSEAYQTGVKPYAEVAKERAFKDYLSRTRPTTPAFSTRFDKFLLKDIAIFLHGRANQAVVERKVNRLQSATGGEVIYVNATSKASVALFHRQLAALSCTSFLWLHVDVDDENISDTLQSMAIAIQHLHVAGVTAKIISWKKEIYHAGYYVGRDRLLSPYCGIKVEHSGYFGRANALQTITAAGRWCFLIQRELFLKMGGYDANIADLETAHIDWCLRCSLTTNHSILYEPRAERQLINRPKIPVVNYAFLSKKHRLMNLVADKHYHPVLNPYRGDFSPQWLWPRHRPWHIEP